MSLRSLFAPVIGPRYLKFQLGSFGPWLIWPTSAAANCYRTVTITFDYGIELVLYLLLRYRYLWGVQEVPCGGGRQSLRDSC